MENAFKNKALYHQLVDLLQERIETCMIPHDKLPSERELIDCTIWSESDDGPVSATRTRK